MTERLYYGDSYLTQFQARVAISPTDPCLVYLDKSAFYPASGGQPPDRGTLGGIDVVDVVDEEERVAHRLASPFNGPESVLGVVDWGRRYDHMQQHTGQHLLSAVLAERFNIPTVSFHMGADVSTIDLDCRANPDPRWTEVEIAANQEVVSNRPVTVAFEDGATATGLRKPSERQGILRVVTIEGLDRSACGGTHVRSTGEIGAVLLRRVEKVRETLRLEFVCGQRAIRRARMDFEHLGRLSRLYSTAVDEVAAVAEGQALRLQEAEKALAKLRLEQARARGQSAWESATRGSDGMRWAIWRRPTIDDEARAEAQGFTGAARACVILLADQPPAILVACSADAGLNAGSMLKEIIAKAGGRGGGGATLAQGNVADVAIAFEEAQRRATP